MLVNTYAHIQQSSRVELGKKFEDVYKRQDFALDDPAALADWIENQMPSL